MEREIVEYLDASNAYIHRQDQNDFETLHVTINKGVNPYGLAGAIVPYNFDSVFSEACSNGGMSPLNCTGRNFTNESTICVGDSDEIIASFSASFLNDELVGHNGPPHPEYTLIIDSGKFSENMRKALAARTGVSLNELDGSSLPEGADRGFTSRNIADLENMGYECQGDTHLNASK
jgi:hypothetical protein